MIQPLQGSGDIGQTLQALNAPSDSPKTKETRSEAIDYKVSFNQEVVETITYDRSAAINTQPLVDSPDFSDLLSRLLKRQGVTFEDAMGGKTVNIDPETQSEAQALVSEDGYWGVEKTSERIFQFAVAGAGGDATKLEKIKAAIDKGFGMVTDMMGGELPEISSKTYDAVMGKLDDWANDNAG